MPNSQPIIASNSPIWWCPDCGDPINVCAVHDDGCPMHLVSKGLWDAFMLQQPEDTEEEDAFVKGVNIP